MKRSKALQPLSRDHHQALATAQKLRRATEPGETAALFGRFWAEHGAHHFQVEEGVLLPLWAKLGRVDERAVARVALEHLRIRTLALEVSEEPTLATLHELGERLAAHVRYEERFLFELIEDDLDATALAEVAAAVERAERED